MGAEPLKKKTIQRLATMQSKVGGAEGRDQKLSGLFHIVPIHGLALCLKKVTSIVQLLGKKNLQGNKIESFQKMFCFFFS